MEDVSRELNYRISVGVSARVGKARPARAGAIRHVPHFPQVRGGVAPPAGPGPREATPTAFSWGSALAG